MITKEKLNFFSSVVGKLATDMINEANTGPMELLVKLNQDLYAGKKIDFRLIPSEEQLKKAGFSHLEPHYKSVRQGQVSPAFAERMAKQKEVAKENTLQGPKVPQISTVEKPSGKLDIKRVIVRNPIKDVKPERVDVAKLKPEEAAAKREEFKARKVAKLRTDLGFAPGESPEGIAASLAPYQPPVATVKNPLTAEKTEVPVVYPRPGQAVVAPEVKDAARTELELKRAGESPAVAKFVSSKAKKKTAKLSKTAEQILANRAAGIVDSLNDIIGTFLMEASPLVLKKSARQGGNRGRRDTGRLELGSHEATLRKAEIFGVDSGLAPSQLITQTADVKRRPTKVEKEKLADIAHFKGEKAAEEERKKITKPVEVSSVPAPESLERKYTKAEQAHLAKTNAGFIDTSKPESFISIMAHMPGPAQTPRGTQSHVPSPERVKVTSPEHAQELTQKGFKLKWGFVDPASGNPLNVHDVMSLEAPRNTLTLAGQEFLKGKGVEGWEVISDPKIPTGPHFEKHPATGKITKSRFNLGKGEEADINAFAEFLVPSGAAVGDAALARLGTTPGGKISIPGIQQAAIKAGKHETIRPLTVKDVAFEFGQSLEGVRSSDPYYKIRRAAEGHLGKYGIKFKV